mmetsp:Transcript_96338/g.299482  ORF Transcript_96338/g.299482 Transcript_96338/m.299482 type:complete len:570 (+) Transcript_96338:3-1712(+)
MREHRSSPASISLSLGGPPLMEERLAAFAERKAEEALALFKRGAYSEGLPRAQAALDLLARAGATCHAIVSPLCRGACDALASEGRFCEALQLFFDHATTVADEHVKNQLLNAWMQAVNSPVPGDLVQLSSRAATSITGCRQQLVGTVVSAGSTATQWRVRLHETAVLCRPLLPSLPSASLAPSQCVAEELQEVDVDAAEVTLLTLRVTEEQRERWLQLVESCPGLFGKRMAPENEARWKRLFGACAARHGGAIGVSAASSSADEGLPLEQSFVATLHGVLVDFLRWSKAQRAASSEGARSLVVDVLGCRPALELADPEAQLSAVLACSFPAGGIRSLTVRMCGPEAGGEPWSTESMVGDGRRLRLDVRPGLYHDVFPEGGADIVVAMNAGIGVPQYKVQWAPTLDLLGTQPRQFLLAVTTYSPGELLREEQLLRRWWAEIINLETCEQLAVLNSVLSGPPPWTLAHDVHIPDGVASLRRGDGIEPWLPAPPGLQPAPPNMCRADVEACLANCSGATALAAVARGPWTFRVLRAGCLCYAGPNPTPGRSRNYGKLLMWLGGTREAAARS